MTDLTETARAWMATGQFISLDQVEIFFRVEGNTTDQKPWLVCFHGFPTSSWDWHDLLPQLALHHRVLVFDFPGYGLSGKPAHRDYRLQRQMDVTEKLLDYLQIESFDLLSHDMGNSVACELLRRRESADDYRFELCSLSMLNGGVYMDLHRPLLTQRLLRTPLIGALTARFSSYRVFRAQYPQVYARPNDFNESHYLTQWSLIRHNEGGRTLHKIAGYMKDRVRMGKLWTGPLERLEIPLGLVWGLQDKIAMPAIADRLKSRNPSARVSSLPESAHYPQLEQPREISWSVEHRVFKARPETQ